MEREDAERSERGVDETRQRDIAGSARRDIGGVGFPAKAAAVDGGGRGAAVEEVGEAAKPLRDGEGEVDGKEEENGGGHEVGAGRSHFGWPFSLDFGWEWRGFGVCAG